VGQALSASSARASDGRLRCVVADRPTCRRRKRGGALVKDDDERRCLPDRHFLFWCGFCGSEARELESSTSDGGGLTDGRWANPACDSQVPLPPRQRGTHRPPYDTRWRAGGAGAGGHDWLAPS
jgi:hypothetical protein